jgi:hypothetical protein
MWLPFSCLCGFIGRDTPSSEKGLPKTVPNLRYRSVKWLVNTFERVAVWLDRKFGNLEKGLNFAAVLTTSLIKKG